MKLFRRRKRKPIQVFVKSGDDLRPAWALRAGQLIVATDYSHGSRSMIVQVMDMDRDLAREIARQGAA